MFDFLYDAPRASNGASSSHPENQLIYTSTRGLCIHCLERPIKHIDAPRAETRKRCYAFCSKQCAIGYAADCVELVNGQFCHACEEWLDEQGKCPNCARALEEVPPCDGDAGKDGEK